MSTWQLVRNISKDGVGFFWDSISGDPIDVLPGFRAIHRERGTVHEHSIPYYSVCVSNFFYSTRMYHYQSEGDNHRRHYGFTLPRRNVSKLILQRFLKEVRCRKIVEFTYEVCIYLNGHVR